MDTEVIDFSVVIPAYNEELTIEVAVSRIHQVMTQLNRRFEIVIVCDGDDNKTVSALQHLCYAELSVIDLEVNRGKGFALRTGAAAASGKNLIFIDADLDLDARRLPELILLYENQDLDLLVGSKLHPESIVNYPKSRRIMSFGYRQIIKRIFGLNVSDTQTGLKVCKRDKFMMIKDDLFVDGFAFDLELICRFEKQSFKIAEGPVTLNFQFKSTVDHQSLLSIVTVSIDFKLTMVLTPRITVMRIEIRIEYVFLDFLPNNKNSRVNIITPIMELDRQVGYPTK